MKKYLFLFILLLCCFPLTAHADVYQLQLQLKEDGKIGWLNLPNTPSVSLLKGEEFGPPTKLPEGNYQAKIFSFRGKLLEVVRFNPQQIFFVDTVDPETKQMIGSVQKMTAGPFALYLPYRPNAQYIEILDQKGGKNLKVYVGNLSICNENKICEKQETKQNCPADCSLVSYLSPAKYPSRWRWLFYLGLGILISAVIFLLVHLVKKKRSS